MIRTAVRDPDRGEGGFTLLEVMVALGILALSLVTLSQITTNNVRVTHHAKMVTTATFLARAKIADLEDLIQYEGFVDTDQEDSGDFSEESRPEFRWKTLIEKIHLPADLAQKAQDANQQKMEENSQNPLAAMSGLMGGFMTTLLEPIRVGIEESVRRVTVQVFWNEPGRPDQSFDVVTFMTDPAKLDLAVQAIGQPLGGDQQQQGQGGTGGASGRGSSSGAAGGSGSSSSGRTSSPSGSGTPAPTGGRR
jgi:prepilin-type N-terminal cleavage/methylation domain-containing protein